LRNSFYNVLSGVVKAGCTVVITPIMIRLLGLDQYGLWVIVSSFLSIAAIAEAGLTISTTVFLTKDLSASNQSDFSKTLTSSVSIMLIVALSYVGIINLFMDSFLSIFPKLGQLDKNVLESALRLISVSIFLQLMQQVLVGVEQAYQQYKLMNILEVSQLLLTGVGGVVLSYMYGNIYTLTQWQVVISLVFFTCHIKLVSNLIKSDFSRVQFSLKKSVLIIKYSFFNWISVLSMTLFSRGDRLIVGSVLGASTLAIYSAILEASAVITSFTTRSVSPLLPVISSARSSDWSDKNISAQIEKFTKLNIYIAIIISLLISSVSPLIINLIIPGKIEYSYILGLQLASFVTAFSSMSGAGYFILSGTSNIRLISIIFMVSALLSLFLIRFLAEHFGIIGAILGNAGWMGTMSITMCAMHKLNISSKSIVSWFSIPISSFIVLTVLIMSFVRYKYAA
jgi:O-antigen/teichoic acid export membrane protein